MSNGCRRFSTFISCRTRQNQSTPVVAYEGGSVPEVMENGATGFIVNEIEQAVEAVGRVRDLSRARCHEVFEKRFTASRMASDYVDVYQRLIDADKEKSRTDYQPPLS